jgi:hypothetical protein
VNGDLDNLAWTAAVALVSAMTTDSWEAVKRRFAVLIGHEGRMEASRAEIAATTGPDRHHVQEAQARAWNTRLRDLLDDDPGASQVLHRLVTELNAGPSMSESVSQHARAEHNSQTVNIGGDLKGSSGEMYVGVGKVDKRQNNFRLNPFMLVADLAKKATSHPAAATTTTAVVVLGAAVGAGWHAHWPASVFGSNSSVNGSSNSPHATPVFNDSYSRWQLHVSDQVSTAGTVTFSHGLVLVAEESNPAIQVTAYQEGSGAQVWSRDLPSSPVVAGNLLLALTYPTPLTAYHARDAAGPCASAISRINPATGKTIWTSSLATTACHLPTATSSYVVAGSNVLSAANGATLQQLPTESQAWAFGRGILVQDGSALTLDTLQEGHLQPMWRHEVAAGYTVSPETPQIILSKQGLGSGPASFKLMDPSSGAITKSITALGLLPVPDGVDVLSKSGRLLFISASRVRTGPKAGFSSFSGGIFWKYRSPNGNSTGPVYAYAMNPESFKILGRLVTSRSEVSAEGNDSFVVSDGAYAAIVAAPVIYIYKL